MEKTNFAIQFLLLLCCLRSSSFHFLSAYSLALYFNSRFGYCVRLYIQGFFFVVCLFIWQKATKTLIKLSLMYESLYSVFARLGVSQGISLSSNLVDICRIFLQCSMQFEPFTI